MTFVVILIILILCWMVFGDKIKAWFQRFMMRRMEDAIRKGMGMPSRKEEEEARRRAGKASRSSSAGSRAAGRAASASAYSAPEGHIIPPEYAEDVEYTEFREYSETIDISADREKDGRTRVKVESQVSDAEYIELKG